MLFNNKPVLYHFVDEFLLVNNGLANLQKDLFVTRPFLVTS